MDFKNVPKKYRPIPFWSWNEKLEAEETVRQVELMDEQGIGGFFMHTRGGLQTEYMGDEWFENVQACVDKCEENGMYPYAYDENGWPSGFGNGAVNGKGAEYQQKRLRYEKGEKNAETTIANVNGYHFYYEINPFYVDTLDKKVVKCFIEEAYQPYYEKVKGKLEGIFTDEPQITREGIPWSFILPEEYNKEYGEDIIEILPELFFEIGNYKHSRLKFWRLVTKLFSESYMKQIYDWCTEHNLKFTGHMVEEDTMRQQITTNGACMPHYEYMHIPGMDWLGRHNNETLTHYQVASIARQMGKKQVLSETFAMCGHNVGHDELKWIYESLVVIDDRKGRKESFCQKELKALDLSGEWQVANVTDNSLTIDKCDYYFDGELQEKGANMLTVMNKALELERKVKVECRYNFTAEYVPGNLCLVCETPEIFDIEINGEKTEKIDCGYFRDKSFRKLDISKYIRLDRM